MKYNIFIGLIRNYANYNDELKALRERKKELFYEHTGVRGVSSEGVRAKGSELARELARLNQIEMIEEIDNLIDFYKRAIDYCDDVLEKQDDDIKDLLKAIYIDNRKLVDVAKEKGISKDNLVYLIKSNYRD